MNFSEKVAKYALQKTDNNVERALDYILSHENIEAECLQNEE